MLRKTILCAAAAAALLHGRASAQAPAVPAVPAAPVAPAAPAPANIWSRILLTPEQKKACKDHICASPLTPILGGLLTPIRAASGGLLPRICPGPLDAKAADLLKPADSAEGAAAKIKKSEAEAKARRAAVRFLGTVDCARFPEAEAALVGSLRGDTNECVRYEAALALGSGCCCTKKVIEALTDAVSRKKTNDPIERSPRVRAAAAVALHRCLACYKEDAPKPPEKGVAGPAPEAPPEPGRDEAAEARRAIDGYRGRLPMPLPVAAARPAAARVAPPAGRRDVWSLLMFSVR